MRCTSLDRSVSDCLNVGVSLNHRAGFGCRGSGVRENQKVIFSHSDPRHPISLTSAVNRWQMCGFVELHLRMPGRLTGWQTMRDHRSEPIWKMRVQ